MSGKKYADIIVNLQMKNDFYWLIKHFDDRTLDHIRSHFDKDSGKTFINAFMQLQNADIPADSDEGQKKPGVYFISLAIFIAVSLSIASIIGMAVKDPAKTSMFSIIVFLPSIIFSGIMFPIELLPKAFKTTGKLFPATWGYKLMAENVFKAENLLPLLLIFVFAAIVCSILLRRIDK